MNNKEDILYHCGYAQNSCESVAYRLQRIVEINTGMKPGDPVYDEAVSLAKDARLLKGKITRLMNLINTDHDDIRTESKDTEAERKQ